MYYNKKYCPELIKMVADKYDAYKYMEKIGEKKYLKKLYGVYNDPDEINFDLLPNKFALKITQESGLNIICIDKKKLNIDETKVNLRKMLNLAKRCAWRKHELAWINNRNPKILVEEFLEKNNGEFFDELRFFCFNGEPKFVLVLNDYLNKDGEKEHHPTRNIYDIDWNPIKVKMSNEDIGYVIEKPSEYEEALSLAKRLCKEFLFLRVDLYVGDGKVYLSEFTVAPAGFNRFEPDKYDYIFGNMLTLPNVKVF